MIGLALVLSGCASEQRWVRTLETPETRHCFDLIRNRTCVQFVYGSLHAWLESYKTMMDESETEDVRFTAYRIKKQTEIHLRKIQDLEECWDSKSGMGPHDWLVKLGVDNP